MNKKDQQLAKRDFANMLSELCVQIQQGEHVKAMRTKDDLCTMFHLALAGWGRGDERQWIDASTARWEDVPHRTLWGLIRWHGTIAARRVRQLDPGTWCLDERPDCTVSVLYYADYREDTPPNFDFIFDRKENE